MSGCDKSIWSVHRHQQTTSRPYRRHQFHLVSTQANTGNTSYRHLGVYIHLFSSFNTYNIHIGHGYLASSVDSRHGQLYTFGRAEEEEEDWPVVHPSPGPFEREKKKKRSSQKGSLMKLLDWKVQKKKNHSKSFFFFKRKLTKPPFTSVKIIKSRRKRRRTSAAPAKKKIIFFFFGLVCVTTTPPTKQYTPGKKSLIPPGSTLNLFFFICTIPAQADPSS